MPRFHFGKGDVRIREIDEGDSVILEGIVNAIAARAAPHVEDFISLFQIAVHPSGGDPKLKRILFHPIPFFFRILVVMSLHLIDVFLHIVVFLCRIIAKTGKKARLIGRFVFVRRKRGILGIFVVDWSSGKDFISTKRTKPITSMGIVIYASADSSGMIVGKGIAVCPKKSTGGV